MKEFKNHKYEQQQQQHQHCHRHHTTTTIIINNSNNLYLIVKASHFSSIESNAEQRLVEIESADVDLEEVRSGYWSGEDSGFRIQSVAQICVRALKIGYNCIIFLW